MEKIIGAFSTLLVLLFVIFSSAALINAASDASAAKEFKADVIAELENSDFNPYVVNECIAQAQAAGYTLQIGNLTYDADNNVKTAEVILTYGYELPIFGISQVHETRGIAR